MKDETTCTHAIYLWHTPTRNRKTCVECAEVADMTHAECWRNRESFEDPWIKLYEGKPGESV